MLREIWNDIRHRVRALAGRSRFDRDLQIEIEAHLAREADALVRRGVPPADARRQARLAFGPIEDLKERSREARGTALVESLIQDTRYALRSLAARPIFAAGVVVTLAFGIGANAAMFGMIDRLLFRPPADLREADRVHRVYLTQVDRGREVAQRYTSIGTYLDVARDTHGAFQIFAAWTTQRRAVGDGATTTERLVCGASASYFDLFAIRPVIGRFYDRSEDVLPTGTPVVVLGYPYWQAAFGGSPGVLGQTLRIGATPFTIIGVAPRDFSGMDVDAPPAVYVPFAAFVWDSRPGDHADDYHWTFAQMAARRRPGVAAAPAADALTAALNRSWIKSGKTETARAAARPRAILGPVQIERGPLATPNTQVATWIGGVAAIVLLIACANVAHLLLARAVTRGREIAMRLALGVSFARLTRHLFVEGALLVGAGGVGALWIAQAIGGLVSVRMLSADAPRPDLTDAPTIAMVVLTSALATFGIGMAPVLHARRTNLVQALGGGSRHTDPRAARTRSWLLAAQLSLSVTLLIGAGLFVRSFQNARGLDLGYQVDRIVVVSEHRRGNQAQPAGGGWEGLEARLTGSAARLPGAVAASPATTVPFWGFEGYPLSTVALDTQTTAALGNFLLQAGAPDYFKMMGTRLVQGRGFDARDRATSPPVVVVSDAMARALWPDGHPLGQCLYIHRTPEPRCSTVVGIAADTHAQALDDSREFMYYLPIAQYGDTRPTGTVLVRVAGRAGDMADVVRQALQPLMPADGYLTAVPLSQRTAAPLRSWQLGATMFTAFGALAFLVAAVGLYSGVAYGVAQRTREVAIRLALGATRRSVLGLMLSGALRPVLVSLAIGSAAAACAARWIEPLLFRISPRDPLVYAGVAVALLLVALVATYVPARTASRVDPNSALRAE